MPPSGAARSVKAAGGLLLFEAALLALLQVILISTGGRPVMPAVIVGVLAAAVGIGLLVRPSRMLCIAGVALMVVDLLGSGRHELAALSSPDGGQVIFAAVSLLAMTSALLVSAAAAAMYRAPDPG
jgi:hypothetical protein